MDNNTPKKRVYRSSHDRMIGGVCGGLAQHFNADPSLIRIIFVVLLLLGGVTLFAYLIMWVVFPLNPSA